MSLGGKVNKIFLKCLIFCLATTQLLKVNRIFILLKIDLCEGQKGLGLTLLSEVSLCPHP